MIILIVLLISLQANCQENSSINIYNLIHNPLIFKKICDSLQSDDIENLAVVSKEIKPHFRRLKNAIEDLFEERLNSKDTFFLPIELDKNKLNFYIKKLNNSWEKMENFTIYSLKMKDCNKYITSRMNVGGESQIRIIDNQTQKNYELLNFALEPNKIQIYYIVNGMRRKINIRPGTEVFTSSNQKARIKRILLYPRKEKVYSVATKLFITNFAVKFDLGDEISNNAIIPLSQFYDKDSPEFFKDHFLFTKKDYENTVFYIKKSPMDLVENHFSTMFIQYYFKNVYSIMYYSKNENWIKEQRLKNCRQLKGMGVDFLGNPILQCLDYGKISQWKSNDSRCSFDYIVERKSFPLEANAKEVMKNERPIGVNKNGKAVWILSSAIPDYQVIYALQKNKISNIDQLNWSTSLSKLVVSDAGFGVIDNIHRDLYHLHKTDFNKKNLNDFKLIVEKEGWDAQYYPDYKIANSEENYFLGSNKFGEKILFELRQDLERMDSLDLSFEQFQKMIHLFPPFYAYFRNSNRDWRSICVQEYIATPYFSEYQNMNQVPSFLILWKKELFDLFINKEISPKKRKKILLGNELIIVSIGRYFEYGGNNPGPLIAPSPPLIPFNEAPIGVYQQSFYFPNEVGYALFIRKQRVDLKELKIVKVKNTKTQDFELQEHY